MSPQPGICLEEKENSSKTSNAKSATPKHSSNGSAKKKLTPKSTSKKMSANPKGMMDLSKWLVKKESSSAPKKGFGLSSANDSSETEIISSSISNEVIGEKRKSGTDMYIKNSSSESEVQELDSNKRKSKPEITEDDEIKENELNLSGRKKRNAAKRRRIMVLDSDDDSDPSEDVNEGARNQDSDSDFEIEKEDDTGKSCTEAMSEAPSSDASELSPSSEDDDEDEEESLAAIKKKVVSKAVTKTGWGSLTPFNGKVAKNAAKKPTKSPRTSMASKKASFGAGTANLTPATKGGVPRSYNDECANLNTISEPQAMFDDMVSKLPEIKKLHKHLNGRSLRVATMCSGTESPILALDMIALAAKAQYDIDINIEHVFSCEIEPFKQAYIERNFHPPILFRDIRELGNQRAMTAYGSMTKVPGECDILIAGTSCVDYSNLNTKQKTITQKGESGQTFRGMLQWIKKFQPPLVIIENVSGAPWDTKVKIFEEELNYHADFLRMDTKAYYIPHTRQRGYLVGVLKGSGVKGSTFLKEWKEKIQELRRPASAVLDAFMFPNDDPRVLKGRQRLADEEERSGRVDWARCESRHLFARVEEELGDKRPLTGWSDSGNTTMPSFAWNEWCNGQVHRVQDLMDINTLRLAKHGLDCTYKTMIWNLSQNVDRDTMGKLGLSQCLTPTGEPYVINRGGPLVGEELLLLQGIPADDLLLTRETEKQLRDLAGNAMSTTVVGACSISALVLAFNALRKGDDSSKKEGKQSKSFVRAPITIHDNKNESAVSLTYDLGEYENKPLPLEECSQQNNLDKSDMSLRQLLKEAFSSSRLCMSESQFECVENILICALCGHTSSRICARPPRKFEEHSFVKYSRTRLNPKQFERKLLHYLPMRIQFCNLNLPNDTAMPDGCPLNKKEFEKWVETFNNLAVAPLFFSGISRAYHKWIVRFVSSHGYLELIIGYKDEAPTWRLFANLPPEAGPLRESMENHLATMTVDISNINLNSLLEGSWSVIYPAIRKVNVSFSGQGKKVESWEAKLGLKGQFDNDLRYSSFKVETSDNALGINGSYNLLPRCGAACGSLHKHSKNKNLFFYLEAERCTLSKDDKFVISNTKERLQYGEKRIGKIITFPGGWRPECVDKEQITQGTIWGQQTLKKGKLTAIANDSKCNLKVIDNKGFSVMLDHTKLDSWNRAPVVVSCSAPLRFSETNHNLWSRMENKVWHDINLQKSKSVMENLAWIVKKLSLPKGITEWHSLARNPKTSPRGFHSEKCSPKLPYVRWMAIQKGNSVQYVPKEDVQEAGQFERALKERPGAWNMQLMKEMSKDTVFLQIGLNPISLVHRARGMLVSNDAEEEGKEQDEINEEPWEFSFRVIDHIDLEKNPTFPKLTLCSNKEDKESKQPPNFKRYPLRVEQLRSLNWMLEQESPNAKPFIEEEVCESILGGGLGWRAEGKVERKKLIQGGIVADQVGYGKTAITLGLIDMTTNNCPDARTDLFSVNATLVVVPSHLTGQWPNEIGKFLGKSKNTIVIKDMNSFNNLTIKEVEDADIVVVNFTVLSSDKYHERLARLAGANAGSLPAGKKGGRHFNAVYGECLRGIKKRAKELRQNSGKNILNNIDQEARTHVEEEEQARRTGQGVRLDGKKAVYKQLDEDDIRAMDEDKNDCENKALKKSKTYTVPKGVDRDPWALSTIKDDYKRMKCPPLEIFHWKRVVIDEFHYLAEKADRARVYTLVLGLKSTFRWCLSGTPPHANFNDIKGLANLLGVHLGIDEVLPGTKTGGRGAGLRDASNREKTACEKFAGLLEMRSVYWHERRHLHAQKFLDKFVRQNIAEIDEIPYEEHEVYIELPPAERAIYLELETHLKSLEMNKQKAVKCKKNSKGDRDKRMQQILEESTDAEEALLKRCAHFDLTNGDSGLDAMQTCIKIIKFREKQLEDCILDLKKNIEGAMRQKSKILKRQPKWDGCNETLGGEVQDRLGLYQKDVLSKNSVNGGADEEVHQEILRIWKKAEDHVKQTGTDKVDPRYFNANYGAAADNYVEEDSDDETDQDEGKSKKQKTKKKVTKKPQGSTKNDSRSSEEIIYAMKYELREHVHDIRSIGKELCGRMRSLRFFRWVRNFQLEDSIGEKCIGDGCEKTKENGNWGVLSCCGHVGCVSCLQRCADSEICIVKDCKAMVRSTNVVSSKALGADNTNKKKEGGGEFGAKLTKIVENVKEIVTKKEERVLIFVQFKDLKEKVAQALESHGVKTLQVKGTVQTQVKSLDVMQKEVSGKQDPKVLLLTMDDESSSGVNLTTANHAIFVHPLLAIGQQQYNAYETQAIGRIRRYGQTRKVNVWRYLAKDTIDIEIYSSRKNDGQSKTPKKEELNEEDIDMDVDVDEMEY